MMMNADLRDYMLYNRIVIGIAKTIETTQNAKLRDQNQALIDHVHYIRHATQVSSRGLRTEPDDRTTSRKNLLDDQSLMIFEMEV